MNKTINLFSGFLFFVSSVFATGNQIYVPKTLIFSNWGTGLQEFGLKKGVEIETAGAHTFCLDKEGNIYICDTIKGYIKKFDNRGVFLGNIGFNISGSAIAVGNEGHIFVLHGHTIHEYLPSGNIIKNHSISNNIQLIEGYGQRIRIDRFENILIDKLQKSYQIGSLVGGKLEVLAQENQLISEKKGLPNFAGDKWFETKWEDKNVAKVKILSNKGNILKEISMDTPDVFGAVLFLGQDKNGYIYIETERITPDNYVHLEVRKYNEIGSLLCVTELPNDYYTTLYKKIELDELGNIYQLLTLPEGVKLIKWEQR